MTTRSQHTGTNPQLPDRGAGKTLNSTLRTSLSETANPAIPPEHLSNEDVFHTEDDSYAEEISDAEDDFLVSITYLYSTITARARSFQGIVLTGVTPLLLAQNGFYYQPSGANDLACCFACQSTRHLSTFQHTRVEEVQQLHEEDCIWQIISCDLKYHLGTSNKAPFSATASSPSKRSTHTIDSSTQTTVNSGIRPQSALAPLTSTTGQNRVNANLDCRSHPPPPVTTNLEPQLPRPTCSPQLLQPTPIIISSPHNQQPTYASILQHPVSSPQSTPKPDKPVPPTIPTLTVEDLHRRFHNKPSPFQLEKKRSQRSKKRTRNKAASATQSLSRFLASALPAFSRFLTEMQPKSDTCYPSQSHFNYSRAMRAA